MHSSRVAIQLNALERLLLRIIPGCVTFSFTSSRSSVLKNESANAHPPFAPTYFHHFWLARALLSVIPSNRHVLQPVRPAGYLDERAVVAQAVRDRARRHVVPEDVVPPSHRHVRGGYGRTAPWRTPRPRLPMSRAGKEKCPQRKPLRALSVRVTNGLCLVALRLPTLALPIKLDEPVRACINKRLVHE